MSTRDNMGERLHIPAKVAFLIIVATCLVSAGYPGGMGSPPDDAGRATEPPAGTAWRLVGYCADNGSVIAPLPGEEPIIVFGDDAATAIKPVATVDTHPAAGQESRYRELLAAAASYRVECDRLVISGPSGRDLLIFVQTGEA